jgi:hypothetical protein
VRISLPDFFQAAPAGGPQAARPRRRGPGHSGRPHPQVAAATAPPCHLTPALPAGTAKRRGEERRGEERVGSGGSTSRYTRPSVSGVRFADDQIDRPAFSAPREHSLGPPSVQVVGHSVASRSLRRSRRSCDRGVLHLDLRRPDAAKHRQGQGGRRKQGKQQARRAHSPGPPGLVVPPTPRRTPLHRGCDSP